jgi:hypothetical protein
MNNQTSNDNGSDSRSLVGQWASQFGHSFVLPVALQQWLYALWLIDRANDDVTESDVVVGEACEYLAKPSVLQCIVSYPGCTQMLLQNLLNLNQYQHALKVSY